MRSGLRALIMHSLWSEVLFFHSWGNISFSGHSDSTSFFQRLAEPSMSRSRFLNSSTEHRDWWRGEGKVGERGKKRKKYCIFKKCCCNVIGDACWSFWPLRGRFTVHSKKWELKFAKKKVEVKKKRDKEKKGVLIVPRAYINKIYSNGNAEYTGFSFFHNGPGGLAEYAFAASPAKTRCTGWQPPYPICRRSSVTQRGTVSGRGTSDKHAHTLSWCLDNLLNRSKKSPDKAETFTDKVSRLKMSNRGRTRLKYGLSWHVPHIMTLVCF